MKRLALFAAVISTTAGTQPASATILDPNFTESRFLTNFSDPTGIAWAPDGSQRLFISTKAGAVRIIENGVLVPTPFATISPVYTNSECGVIGLAFDPNFINSRYVYFFVTVSASEQQIIRYTANGNVGTNKTTIVPNLPTAGQNHDGGAIAFGPDGKLYWAIGDNGNGTGVDADLTSLAAKIGRANADGSVPSDNPYVDGAGPNADLIWARGFRNPFTMTFQPSTDLLWVNSVGTAYEQVFVVRRGDHAGYNDYENNQPSGFITPVVAYRTSGVDSRTIAGGGATRSGNTATFTTTAAHGFRLGGKITTLGVTDTSFNGSGYVTALPSATQFSIAQTGPNATSGGGTATTLDIGGAITGGTFWESSSLPAAYRGNFFFGDYVSGRIERVTLNSSNVVTSVDHWANYNAPIDLDVGPDGDLYYLSYVGVISRATPVTTTQALVVSRRFVRMMESGNAAFNVRLAIQPSASVSVTVSRASGDADVSVSQGAALSFSTTDWSTPKPVILAAAADADTTEDSAIIAVASAGLTTENVTVQVTDDNTVRPPTDGGVDGTAGTGGVDAAGGTAGTADAAGGSAGSGGGTSDAAGGSVGSAGSAGSVATGGAGPGGTNGSGGTGDASTTGGAAGAGAASGGRAGATPAAEDEGCGCRTAGSDSASRLGALALLLVIAGRRLRRDSKNRQAPKSRG